MPLSDLLGEALEAEGTDYWDRERTVTPIWAFAVQFHSAGLSLRETVAILDLLDVDRPHGAVWNWTHRLAENQTDRRGVLCSGSRLARRRSRSERNGSGVTPQSIWIQ